MFRMTDNTPALPAYIQKIIDESFNAELEVLAYISKAEDGVVILEELEDKHFANKQFKKYFSILKNLHVTNLEKPDIEMQIVKDQIELITPLQARDSLIKRIKEYWFAIRFCCHMELSVGYLPTMSYTKIREASKKVIDATFSLLENEAKTSISTMGDTTFEELYKETSIDSYKYSSLKGVLIRPACVYVIGGRPGHGKTTFALNLMLRSTAKSAFFSYEMPVKKLQDILVRAEFDIPSYDIKNEKQKIIDGLHSLAEQDRIYLVESSSLTIDRLIAKIRFFYNRKT